MLRVDVWRAWGRRLISGSRHKDVPERRRGAVKVGINLIAHPHNGDQGRGVIDVGQSSGRTWFFDFHFALKEQVRDAFHRQLHHLPPEFVGVVMDVQERGTLPIGPNEVGE